MFLERIVELKQAALARSQAEIPLEELRRRLEGISAPLDFAGALQGGSVRLIAEVKKASPSKGLLCPQFDPVTLATTYAQNGAAAISVLTEEPHFQGSLEHLALIRDTLRQRELSVPLLRKDFLFDPYQVYESRAAGADAILLIVAILSDAQLRDLLQLSHELGMACLVEVHDEAELERALSAGAKIIGINNRNLHTFETRLEVTQRLRPLVPQGRLVVSESGISSRHDVERLREWGVNAVLVGEALVTAADVAAKVRDLAWFE